MRKIYRSAIDPWVAVLLVGLPLTVIALGVFRLQTSGKHAAFIITEGVFVGFLIALFCVPCVYTLTEEHLHIRCGVITTTIPLTQINRVALSGSWLSGPALSLKRVRIDYGSEATLVSPRDREAFIAELEAAVAAARRRSGTARA